MRTDHVGSHSRYRRTLGKQLSGYSFYYYLRQHNEDNNGTIDLASNATVNERSKHIDVQYHFVRHSVQEGKIKLQRCDTTNQLADPLTKPLDRVKHEELTKRQGLTDPRVRGGVLNIAN